MPNSVAGVLIAAYLVVPGYLFLLSRDAVTARDKRDTPRLVVEAIATSMFFWLLATPALLHFGALDLLSAKDWKEAVADHRGVGLIAVATAAALFLPPVAGVVMDRVINWPLLRRLLGLRHPLPKAWDQVFSNAPARWILVTTDDGTRIGGIWHNKSFASSYPNEEDLYIESVFSLDDTGAFLEAKPDSAGVWIPGSSIKFLEMWDFKEQSNGTQEGGGIPEDREGVRAEGIPAAESSNCSSPQRGFRRPASSNPTQ